eukprot:TRINITY_DN1190_c0_g2_i1.p1 TRINITY_DN1190_c0_g2~~TRINITY_DN1190_c0_g2_i1.p1  ORF type:complete len:456 (+),score=117.59 TRINITY_DN1190_c0_g2_i1:33-1370(+)
MSRRLSAVVSHLRCSSECEDNEEQPKSIFNHILPAPKDVILGTNQMFLADKSKKKLTLGIGAYRTDDGKPLILQCVREAEEEMLNDPKVNKEYLPQNGDVQFCAAAKSLLFGEKCPALNRITTVQSLSGTGALRIAGTFLKKHYPYRATQTDTAPTIYISSPSWENHMQLFTECGLKLKTYRYWDKKGRCLDFSNMLADLHSAPLRSCVLFHACAHNPTGVDPTHEQWKKIALVVRERQLFPIFDSAYQGFASGSLDDDAWAIRYFLSEGFEFLACQSFAKNFGLYAERIGALHVVCASTLSDPSKQHKTTLTDVLISRLNLIIRTMYSSPPNHGALIVRRVLTTPRLRSLWFSEVKTMADQIISRRKLLREKLEQLGTPGTWNHITSQIGMFSFTGLTENQVKVMISKYHIYLLPSSRISMAGVNTKNVNYIAKAIDDVVRNVD